MRRGDPSQRAGQADGLVEPPSRDLATLDLPSGLVMPTAPGRALSSLRAYQDGQANTASSRASIKANPRHRGSKVTPGSNPPTFRVRKALLAVPGRSCGPTSTPARRYCLKTSRRRAPGVSPLKATLCSLPINSERQPCNWKRYFYTTEELRKPPRAVQEGRGQARLLHACVRRGHRAGPCVFADKSLHGASSPSNPPAPHEVKLRPDQQGRARPGPTVWPTSLGAMPEYPRARGAATRRGKRRDPTVQVKPKGAVRPTRHRRDQPRAQKTPGRL
ncbi:hypothetical protein NDU88_007208 [Pleurodeles waltl]|uniref:Uncharacterized protein n=1 Tax=Pleurodeles waltl TaxID=8319 RepID=A0AAV7NSJ4_PLEWA|nr:hypothetical protein NDU88_007208 [Pleurodeles waltl]